MISEGHGIEGRYGGLPDPFGEESFSQIVILPVPFDKTSTYQMGSDKGPAALIEASRNMELYDIETDSQVYEYGIFTAPAVIAATSKDMLEALHQKVAEYISKRKFVVTIGGEHTVSYPAIRAHSERYPALTIVQFDAHADLHPAYEDNPWSHASVMARVKELPSVSKVVAIGIRSMSHDELPELNVADTFFAHDIKNDEIWMNQVMQKIKEPVYITFDLDVFDSSLMPSTGTPEPGGLFWNQTMKLLKNIFQETEVVGFDVVELCPNETSKAPDYLAAKLIYKMLSYKYLVKKE